MGPGIFGLGGDGIILPTTGTIDYDPEFYTHIHICFFKDFIYLFLERGEEREKKRERNINMGEKHQSVISYRPQQRPSPAAQACALTGN